MQKIVEGVYRLETTGFSNGYLIVEDAVMILVDTGPPGRADSILKEIREGGLPPEKLRHIFLTHFHHDHVGNATEISSVTGAQIYIHEADADVVKGKAPVPAGQSIIGKLLSPLLNRAFRFKPIERLVLLSDGSKDFLPYQIIHVPGHTPGSMSLFHPERAILICGDAINHRGGRLSPPPSLFTMDVEKAWESLKRLASLDFSILLPGHGPPIISGAAERVRKLFRSVR